jgi:hypothetical protein
LAEELFSACIERICADVTEALKGCDPAPTVSVGGSKVQQPFEVLVRETVKSVDFSDDVTSRAVMGTVRGSYRVSFTVDVEMWAKSVKLTDASYATLEWFHRACAAIGADKTLGGLCIHAEPVFSSSGTALTQNKYMAAIQAGVRVKAEIPFAEKED